MIGHTHLIQLRQLGVVPKIVFINDYPCKMETEWLNPGEKYGEKWPSSHCTISTHGDLISGLDLRFLVGLTVSISALEKRRGEALFKKAQWFGAKTVGVGVGDWSEIYHA